MPKKAKVSSKNDCSVAETTREQICALSDSMKLLRRKFEARSRALDMTLENLNKNIGNVAISLAHVEAKVLCNKMTSIKRSAPLKTYRVVWKHELAFKASSDKKAHETWTNFDLTNLESETRKANESTTVPSIDMNDKFKGVVTFECETDDYRPILEP